MFDAIIVGLGPTGATMANLLGRRGWRVAVLERAADVYDKPRAITADHEALRVFQEIGLAEDIAETTVPHPGTDFLGVDGELIKKFYPADPPGLLGWEPSFMFVQPVLERTLRHGLDRFPGVEVHLSHEVVGLVQEGDVVRVRVRDVETGATRVLSCHYLLGCDGASSSVRQAMGGTLDDLQFDEEWVVIDALADDTTVLPSRCIQYCRPSRPGTFIVGPGQLRRWEIKVLPGEGASDFATEEAQRAVLREFTDHADSLELVRHAVYRFHAVVAHQWRYDRVFLLGDAAHQMPPFMGQGMCAGIRDAVNLAWKLHDVHRRGASPKLLDTYEVERKAHVRDIVENAKSFGLIIGELDHELALERDRRLRGELLAGTAETIRQNFIPELRDGAIAIDRRTGEPLGAAGELFPQPFVVTEDGTSILMDQLMGDDFVVVTCGHGTWLEGVTVPRHPLVSNRRIDLRTSRPEPREDRREVADTTGVLVQWFTQRRASVAVVRPDKAVYGTASDPAGAAVLLQQLVEDLRHWGTTPEPAAADAGGAAAGSP